MITPDPALTAHVPLRFAREVPPLRASAHRRQPCPIPSVRPLPRVTTSVPPARRVHAASPIRRVAEPTKLTCPILRPGRSSLPYRCTLRVGHPGEQVVQPLVHAHRRLLRRAKHVGHHRHRRDRRRCRRAGSPAPRAGAARTGWCAAPSMVQCPELCGRIASSLTSSSPSTVSNSSTASTPTTPSSAASRNASCSAALGGFAVADPARARSPPRRCRRAARSPPPATPRPGRTASGPPARTARAASSPAPRPAPARRRPRYALAISRACAEVARPSAPRGRRSRRGPS